MQIVDNIAELRNGLASTDEGPVGFVPTMGYLHAGHSSLIEAARTKNSTVAVSIFVNPLQFAPTEDLSAYPRDLERDLERCEAAGADFVFTPSVEEMYPRPILTSVNVEKISQLLEGASRPTHFVGVATVVAKLFSIFGPCNAYFGEKDYQQLCVIRRMAADLSMPVEVIGCPTVREADGLAMSSRNVYLSEPERLAAPILSRALSHGVTLIQRGETSAEAVVKEMEAIVEDETLADLDYLAVLRASDLSPLESLNGELRVLGAIKIGKPRLIDNMGAISPN